MLSKRSIQAARLRTELRFRLGGKCFRCGATIGLQFHVGGDGDSKHHAMSSRDRVYFYLNEFARNNLLLVCRNCHHALTVGQSRARRARRLCQSIAGVS